MANRAKQSARLCEKQSPSLHHAYLFALLSTIDRIVPAEVEKVKAAEALSVAPKAKAAAGALKKAYFKILRLVHPDKVAPTVSLECRLQLERVFSIINSAFTNLRQN